MEKFGRTLLMIVFILFIVKGASMAVKIGYPQIRRVSASLADALVA